MRYYHLFKALKDFRSFPKKEKLYKIKRCDSWRYSRKGYYKTPVVCLTKYQDKILDTIKEWEWAKEEAINGLNSWKQF